MAQMKYDDDERFSKFWSKSPAVSLAARVVTLVSLVISIVILKTNNIQVMDGFQTTNSYEGFRSYKYMFYVMVIGLVYTAVQLPFAAYYMKTKKPLINNSVILKLDFIVDLVLVFFLATAVGAAFGMTVDSMRYSWLDVERSKMEHFFHMALISASFLFIGCVFSAVSLFHSAMALSRN